MKLRLAQAGVHRTCVRSGLAFAGIAIWVAFSLRVPAVRAQEAPKLFIDEDCQAFDISKDNSIVYAVPRLKRVRNLVIERDDISIASDGKVRKIVEADKFMPFPPPAGYIIDSILWSPDGHRIAVNMSLQKAPPGFTDKDAKKRGDLGNDDDNKPISSVTGGRVIALLDDDGREIKVANSKTRFVEDATNGTWLADNTHIVYQTGGGPYSITRVNVTDGKSEELFEGHTFNGILWDAKNNRAYAIGENLGVHKGLTIVRLDLLHETVTEIAHVKNYQGALSLSPSGDKIGYFEDGDYLDVIDMKNQMKSARVRAGYGRFEWSRDERRVLLKRGSFEKSGILTWVGLYDDSFTPELHSLVFHDFHITPDEQMIAVTEPGKRALKVYPLP